MGILNHYKLRLITVTLASLVVFVFLIALIFFQHQLQLENQRQLMHTLQVHEKINNLLVTVFDGETASQRFMLYGNKDLLEPYALIRATLIPQLDKLLALTKDNPVQQNNLIRLKPLLQDWSNENTRQQRLFLKQDSTSAIEHTSLETNLHRSKEIRRLFSKIYTDESRLLQQRTASLNQISRHINSASLVLFGLMLTFILLITFFLQRALNLREKHSTERDALNTELELNKINLQTANKALQQADRLKTEFLSAMSHELRTPLNSIIGFSGILRMCIPGTLNEEQMKQLTIVDDAAKHLLHLISDLLDLSHIETGRIMLNMEDFDLRDVVKETLIAASPMANKKSITLRNFCEEYAIPLHTDRRKVYQIMFNLVSNAIKFSEQANVDVSCCRLENTYEVSILDHGIGITPSQLNMLFQAFRQVDDSARKIYEGAGLSLYLSKKLVEMLGGTIRAVSEHGKGTCFIFTLPIPLQRNAE